MARMMVGSREYVMSRYKLHKIKEIEDMVADAVQIVSQRLLLQFLKQLFHNGLAAPKVLSLRSITS